MMAQEPSPVSIEKVIQSLPGPFQQRDLITANDTVVRIAQFQGEFPWHEHEEDELFLCWDGTFRIDLEGQSPVTLRAGELFVVPKGTRHRPVAELSAHVLMIERPETRQYGRTGPAALHVPGHDSGMPSTRQANVRNGPSCMP